MFLFDYAAIAVDARASFGAGFYFRHTMLS